MRWCVALVYERVFLEAHTHAVIQWLQITALSENRPWSIETSSARHFQPSTISAGGGGGNGGGSSYGFGGGSAGNEKGTDSGVYNRYVVGGQNGVTSVHLEGDPVEPPNKGCLSMSIGLMCLFVLSQGRGS